MTLDTLTQLENDEAGRPARIRRLEPRLHWVEASASRAESIKGTTIVGSSASAQLVLRDPTVSRVHAELTIREDGVWVRDLGSRNGTFVNGVRVIEARIPDGARLTIGALQASLTYGPHAVVDELWQADRYGPLVGGSVVMRAVFGRIDRVARTDATVLVSGETGTGKELVARAIHEASPRAGKPFMVVDCGSIPDSLFESELFGHAKGAFTGAQSARAGALELAEGGTVMLDEIGELPLAVQPKLLRALESRTVRRVGEAFQRPIDARFVAASHRDLARMCAVGAFREDLYYRLAVVPIRVPPLRERPEDIPALIAAMATPEVAQALGARLTEIQKMIRSTVKSRTPTLRAASAPRSGQSKRPPGRCRAAPKRRPSRARSAAVDGRVSRAASPTSRMAGTLRNRPRSSDSSHSTLPESTARMLMRGLLASR